MKNREPAAPDPLIDEVRDRRRRLLAQYDGDLNRFHEAIRRRQEEHPEQVADSPPHKMA